MNKPPMPPQPKTQEIPAVTVPGNTLEAVLAEVRGMRGDLHDMKGDVEMLVGQGRAFARWRGEMEEWRAEVDSAISRQSARAREPSQHDLEAKEELGKERAARVELAERVERIEAKTDEQTQMIGDIRKAVVGVVTNKKVRAIGQVIFVIAMGYAFAHGIKVLP